MLSNYPGHEAVVVMGSLAFFLVPEVITTQLVQTLNMACPFISHRQLHKVVYCI